ncbi:MAG TPA: PQQ-binding-like beta-propeller repeat protein [Candidatus Thermoplasmatota archaeon]|nr:PQQ-binding-like beta-propeller repeat protein [Candidatus Thermoplasmatota archaeon]
MNKVIAPVVIFILLFCLIPVQATTSILSPSHERLRFISPEERYFYRKAYPYEFNALNYQECFSQNQTSPDMLECNARSSASSPSSIGSNGPMNSSWLTKSYNAQRIGRTPSSTANNTGIEKWRFKVLGAGGVESGAAIADNGTIYFGSEDFHIYSLYPNGTLKWVYSTGDPIFSVPALAADGTIYIASCDHYLYALHPDGSLKWRFNLHYLSFSSPMLADNGTIYVGTPQGNLFAVNPNGSCQWSYNLSSGIYGDAALGTDGTIYVGTWDNYLNALNPNGTLKWRFPTGNHVKGVPSVGPDGTIYFGSWDGFLYALYPNGTMRWRCQVGSGSETTPALAEDGTIYVGGDDLYAVYPNGTMRWELSLGSNGHIFQSCPAVAAEGTIYVGVDIGEDTGGEIIVVNPNGTIRWQKTISDTKVDSSAAIASDGTVYIGSTGMPVGNALHAFGATESNTPPNPPTIEGNSKGKTGTEYYYKFTSIDPDDNPVKIYIDWGDGTNCWSYEGASGEQIWVAHTWAEQGTYIIKAKARDTFGAESNWTTLQVTMPLVYEPPHFRFFEWLFDRFPQAFPLLRYLWKYKQ